MGEELYLTGAVIVNGIPDSDGDTLNSVEIRTIFTKYTNHLSDIQHDSIDYEGVDVLANWISNEETTIAGNTIPAKSWMATLKVTDEETLTAVNNKELTCFSLGSVSNQAKTRDAWFINKRISYHDLKSIEDVIPLRISIVDEGANGFPFEVETKEVYINKSKKQEDNTMTEQNEDKKFSLEDLKIIKSIFGKSDDKEETKIEKAEEPETPAPVENDAEKTIEALFEKIDSLIADIAEIKQAINDNAIEKAEKEEKEESADEESKPDDETEEEEKKIEKQDEEAESTEEINKADDEEEKKEEEETKIEKRTQKVADIPKSPETVETFFNRTHRDSMGRKIRN